MIENTSHDLYVRLLENPVTAIGADIGLIQLDHNQLSFQKQGSVGNQTHYKLTIQDPESLGLSSPNENDVNAFISKIILSMNLTFYRAVIDRKQIHLEKSKVEFKNQGSSRVEKQDGVTHVIISEHLHLQESVSVVVGTSEEISEHETLEILKQLNILDQRSGNQILENNLIKAIESYSEAMNSERRILIFKHLFNALELSTNSDGISRKGSSFDSQVSSLSEISASDVEKWRWLYNRLKHVDTNTRDISIYESGIKDIVNEIRQIREITTTILITKLKSQKENLIN